MKPEKLTNMLAIISDKFSQRQIPFCLIGALALGLYGHPRYTSDIDILVKESSWPDISEIMEKLGYTCFQKTSAFAQFDSELGVFGKVDFMFVKTEEGKGFIRNSTKVNEEYFDGTPVIQPTDYIILKLMAIANNPERSLKDEADISDFFRMYEKNLIASDFDKLDKPKILIFGEKFGMQSVINKYINGLGGDEKKQHQL